MQKRGARHKAPRVRVCRTRNEQGRTRAEHFPSGVPRLRVGGWRRRNPGSVDRAIDRRRTMRGRSMACGRRCRFRSEDEAGGGVSFMKSRRRAAARPGAEAYRRRRRRRMRCARGARAGRHRRRRLRRARGAVATAWLLAGRRSDVLVHRVGSGDFVLSLRLSRGCCAPHAAREAVRHICLA
jgi:hypothetical protein